MAKASRLGTIWLLILILIAPAPVLAAEGQGPRLSYADFTVGGRLVRVKAGGILAVHPDAPFRFLDARSDSWLDMGMEARVKGRPEVDLTSFHTLSELLGDQVFAGGELEILIYRKGEEVGQVRLLARPLTIDYLRRAQGTEDLGEKIRYTRLAWEQNPDDRLLLMGLVDLLMEASRYQEAVELLEAHAAGQEDPETLKRLAELYSIMGDRVKAAATLSKLLQERPDDQALWSRLAQLNLELERWQEAALSLERMLHLQEGAERTATMQRLAEVWQRAGDLDKADTYLELAAERSRQDVDLWRRLARLRQEEGKTAKALSAWRQVVRLDPHDPEARLHLADGLMAAGDKRQAAQELAQAAELSPDDPALWLRLARLHRELGDRAALTQAYSHLVPLQPQDADLRYNLAVLLMEDGDPGAALPHLEAALKLRPGDRDILQALLEVLVQKEDWDRVAQVAQELLKEQPGDMRVIELIYSGLAGKKPRTLARILDQAAAAQPQEVKIHELRAALALEQDDPEAAIAALAKAAAARPERLEVWFRLARLQEAQGHFDQAMDSLAKVLDADPDYPGADDLYLRLRTARLERAQGQRGKPEQDAGPKQ